MKRIASLFMHEIALLIHRSDIKMSKKTQGIHRHELFLFRFIHFQYLLFGKVIQLVI